MKQSKCNVKMTMTNELGISVNAIINNLFKEFTCTICLQLFKDPVTVSICKHTYCLDCLKEWKVKSDKSNSKTFKCPLCKNVTTNRSYYSNEKYAFAVKYLLELEVYMESKRNLDTSSNSSSVLLNSYEYKNTSLQRYLNDCIKYKSHYENDAPEIIDSSSQIITNNISNKENNNITGADVSESNDMLITESEENEYILNICSTAENINIINKLEDDFIEDLEKETNTKKDSKTPSSSKKKKVKNENDTPTKSISKTDSAKKTGWSRLKTINRDINKKVGKYKRLKVTETKSKNENTERKRTTRSSKNQTILGDFDEYVQENKNTKNEPIVINTNSEKSTEIIEANIDDDDIFLKSTQILSLDNLNPEVSIIKLSNKRKSLDNTLAEEEETVIKKQKTPDKSENVIVFHADVHHSNDSIVEVPIKSQNKSSSADIIENTAETLKTTKRSNRKNAKLASPKDPLLENLSKEFKESLKKVSKLKSSALQSLEQNLKESEQILSEYSNLIYNSDSLFSGDSLGKHPKKDEPNNKTNVFSAPTLEVTSKDSITFYNTAIPCLEKIRGYYQQLKALSDQLTDQSTISSENNSHKNKNNNKVFADTEIQTDILKCPTCTFTFNLKSATNTPTPRKGSESNESTILREKPPKSSISKKESQSNIPSKESESNSEDFNAFLEDIKKNISKNPPSDSLPEIPEEAPLDDTKKKRFKRIRAPTDSDSEESSETSKKSKSNSYQSKLLYREDIDVCFHSTTSQMYSNIEPPLPHSKSNNLESNKPVSEENTTQGVKNSKSSEDTLLYLEQQYHNPINNITSEIVVREVPENCAITNANNLDNLLSGIDVSAFENDFTITNKNNEAPESSNHQLNQKTELSASLFTETQTNKLNNSIVKTNKVNDETSKNIVDNDSIVEDSYESDEIFEDDIVDTTPQKAILPTKRINETQIHKNASQLELRKLQNPNPNPQTSMTPDFLPLSNLDLNCGFFDNSKFVSSKTPGSEESTQVQNNNLKPILLAQNDDLPLEFVKQQNYVPNRNKTEAVKQQQHQSSILSYFNAHQQSTPISRVTEQTSALNDDAIAERCESPVLHARPAAAAAAPAPALLCTSRLQSKEIADVVTCAPRLNARYSNVFNENVTHLIVTVDENNCVADQTIKYVLAIAHGIWIVSYSWFTSSVSKNRLLPEEHYEVLDMSGIPGPRLSRQRRRECPLFKDFAFYIAEPLATVTKADLEDVIINLGGEIKKSLADMKKYPGKHYLILSEGKYCDSNDQYEILKDKYGIMSVDIEWLSETVGQYKLTSICPYALCSDDNIEMYGYPSELIAPIPESQIQTLSNGHH